MHEIANKMNKIR